MPSGALVIGESLIDLIGTADERGEMVYRPRSGGSPLNVAVGLARLGIDTRFATAIAPDSFGRRLARFLAEEGVAVLDAPDADRGTCLAVVTRQGPDVDFEYFGDTASMLAIGPIGQEVLDASWVIHAGSTAFMDDPARATVASAYGQDRAFRTADPNPRPFLIEDRGRYVARLEEVIKLADLVKLSQEDIDYLYPDMDFEAVTEHLLGMGIRVALITRADRDTIVASAAGSVRVPVPSIDVVDPTGAGDSFSASLLRDLCTHGEPDDLAGWQVVAWRANVAASLTCGSVGGAESMPAAITIDTRVAELVETQARSSDLRRNGAASERR